MVMDLMDPGLFTEIPNETYDDRRSEITLLHRDETNLEVLVQPFGENDDQEEQKTLHSYFVSFNQGGIDFRMVQDGIRKTHTTRSGTKYFTIEDEWGPYLLPFQAHEFPRVVAGNHLKDALDAKMGEVVGKMFELMESFYDGIDNIADLPDEIIPESTLEETMELRSEMFDPLREEVEDAFSKYQTHGSRLGYFERNFDHLLTTNIEDEVIKPYRKETMKESIKKLAKAVLLKGPFKHSYYTTKEKYGFMLGGRNARKMNLHVKAMNQVNSVSPKTVAVMEFMNNAYIRASAGVFRMYGMIGAMGALALDSPKTALALAGYTAADFVINRKTETEEVYGMGLIGVIRHALGADSNVPDQQLVRQPEYLVNLDPFSGLFDDEKKED